MAFVGFLVFAAIAAVVRSIVIGWLNTERFPFGTLVVNTLGSLAAASVVSLAPAQFQTLLGIAALGSFTTFSTFAMEVVAMWSERPAMSALYGGTTAVTAVGAAAVGLGLG